MRRLGRVFAVLIAVGGLCGWWYMRRVRAARAKLPLVTCAEVDYGAVLLTVSGNGVIEPLTVVDVKSKAAGKVLKMPVEVGDFVRKGDLIALIDRDQVGAELQQARADVNAALARVEQAEVNRNVAASTLVTQVEQAQQQLRAAQARLQQAQKALELQRAQYQAQLKEAEQALATARARLKQAEERARAQPQLTQSSIRQAEASYKAALENLRRLKEATHPQARAQAESAVKQAEATLQSAQQALSAQEEELRRLRDAAQPQARAQAKANYEQASARLKQAERNLMRMRELHAKGFVSKRQVEDAEAEYETARAAFDSARTQLETLKQQQSAELAAARARVEEARARVAEAKATLKNAQERLRTLKAQQDAELKDAEARVLEAKAALDAARANEMQVSIARSELDAARAAVQQAEAQLEAVKAQEMQIRMKQLDVDAARAALRQAEASLQVARANTLQVKVREAEVKSARAQTQRALAQLDNARKRFTDTTVVAPRDGVVLQKLVEEGTVISSGMSAFAQGTTIVRLGDMSRVFVDTEVDETDIIHVHVGQPVIVSVDAMPGKEFKGRVVRIDPQTTEEQNVVYVHVRVELFNPDPRLKPGMSTTCEFIVAHKPNVLRAPSEAIRETEFGTTVDVLLRNKPLNARGNPHPKPRAVRVMRRDEEEIWWAIARRVRIGLRGDDYTEIINGLREGEMVVVSYLEREEREERRRIGPFGRRLRRRRR